MKAFRLLFVICLCTLFSHFLNAQNIAFDKIIYDYGIIPDNAGKLESIFSVTNTGKKPLVIYDVKPSCGCTTSEFPKDSIAPGRSAVIRAIYDPQGNKGLFTKYLKVYSNSTDVNEITLAIKGTVKPVHLIKEQEYPYPMELIRVLTPTIDLGDIYYGAIDKDTVKVYNPQDTTVLLYFPGIADYFRVEMLPSNKIPANSEAFIIVYYDPIKRNEWGPVYDKLFVAFEGQPNRFKNRINVNGVIKEDFSKLTKSQLKKAPKIEFKSKEFDFDTISQGEMVSVSYKFTNIGKMPLKIRKIKTSCGCTAGELPTNDILKGEDGEIKVTFNSRGKHNNVMQRISLITNDPTNPHIELIIKGYVKEIPQ